jgi:acyl-CoA thioester hydrolase
MGDAATGNFRYHYTVAVRFRDLDPMGHAHHSLALVYFEEARAAYWRDVAGRADVTSIDYILAEIVIRYHARTHFPDTLDVAVRTTKVGGKSFELEYEVRSGTGELLISGKTVQVMYDYLGSMSKEMPDDIRGKIEAYER